MNENQLRLRRSKQSERDLGKMLLEANGSDPAYALIHSSTGRVGHITDLQFDVVSKDYAAENKLVKVPKKILSWWIQIGNVARTHGKKPLLRIVPSNEGRHPAMHIISEERHLELLRMEQFYRQYTNSPEAC